MDQQSELDTSVILAIVAHPDDLEFGAAGSIAKWIKEGSEAYYCICTDGSKGSDDPTITSEQLVKTRRNEQQAAGKVLGLKDVFFLDYEDGFLESTRELKKDLVRIIRHVKPTLVITWDPEFNYSTKHNFYNHNDHRASGRATLDAVYPLARDRLSFPDLIDEDLAPHRVPTVLLFNFDKPDYFVDITETLESKLTALDQHESQISDRENLHELITSIANEYGKACGCQHAEGFKRLDLL